MREIKIRDGGVLILPEWFVRQARHMELRSPRVLVIYPDGTKGSEIDDIIHRANQSARASDEA